MITTDQLKELIQQSDEGRITRESLQLFLENPGMIPGASWQRIFGHLRVWDGNFNPSNFPLVDDGDEAEEFGFGELVTGHQAIERFTALKREGASLGAQGRYIKAHPQAQRAHPLGGIGAQWSREGRVWFPFFFWDGGRPYVDLSSLVIQFDPGWRFLLRKAAGI